MPRLTLDELRAVRAEPSASALLFLTDRCPVGCAHCSVDSRPDRPRITDFAVFAEVVEGLCSVKPLRVIGVSGGEPFVERRGLELATRRIVEAGKTLVVYTSGMWAVNARPPRWIADVLGRSSCVVFGTDSFHAARIPPTRLVAAVRATAAAGAWVGLQVLDRSAERAAAVGVLRRAFGRSWQAWAQIQPVPLLPVGRAAALASGTSMPGRTFGRCRVAGAVVVRYDGQIAACCNEAVVTGAGPSALHRRAGNRDEVVAALAHIGTHTYFAALAGAGTGALTRLPRYRDLGDRRYRRICDLCWQMLERGDPPGPDVRAVALLASGALR